MKTDIVAFLSDDLFNSSEEETWNQAVNSASIEGVTAVYLLPDCHTGFGIPIGCCVVTDNVLIQAASGYDINCFTGDTKIPLVDGRELTLKELSECYKNDEEFYVYSITPDGFVTTGKAKNPRKTHVNAVLVEVELDNGEKVRCTPDHRWMLRDGSYCEAKDLKSDVSLMPFYRFIDKSGYYNVKHPVDNSVEKMYRVSFREKYGYVPEWPNVVHHDIFNEKSLNNCKLNDDPNFLIEMNENDHFILHSSKASELAKASKIGWGRLHQMRPEQMSEMSRRNILKLHSDPEFKSRQIVRAKVMYKKCREEGKFDKNWSEAGQRGREGLIAYNKSEKGRETSRRNGIKNKGRKQKLTAEQKSAISSRFKGKRERINCEFCGKNVAVGAGLFIHLKSKHNNHKVVSVKFLNEIEDVYCITVEKYENFAISAGTFVHNCGVQFVKIKNADASLMQDKAIRRKWIDQVEKRVATGKGINRPALMKRFGKTEVENVLRRGAESLGISKDVCERQFIDIPDNIDLNLIQKAFGSVEHQLGSVGGGNHFVELQADKDDGSAWVMVHCGSRGYGWQTANHFFHAGAAERGLPTNRREDSWLYADTALGKQYWAYHNSAANFAIANRHIIVEGIREATQEVFNADLETYYEISHNLVQQETLVLPDGTTKKGFVHRKGATRAMPGGHPDLVGTVWEKTGHPVCIPGSMYDGAAILYPSKNAYASACTVNHGSGRVMARGEAKRQLASSQGQINSDMDNVVRTFAGTEIEGIISNHRQIPLDECRHVYKDLDQVLNTLEEADIAKIDRRLFPIANIKGSD
jgi:tRNA-splicing ligase RtcB